MVAIKLMKGQKVTKGIKLTIDKEFLSKFEAVKEYLGLENDAEVVRFLVNAYYRDVVLPKLKEFKSEGKWIKTDEGIID